MEQFFINVPTPPLMAGNIIYFTNIDVDDFSELNSVHIWCASCKYEDLMLFVEQDPTELKKKQVVGIKGFETINHY